MCQVLPNQALYKLGLVYRACLSRLHSRCHDLLLDSVLFLLHHGINIKGERFLAEIRAKHLVWFLHPDARVVVHIRLQVFKCGAYNY